jgi:hypothetical protein
MASKFSLVVDSNCGADVAQPFSSTDKNGSMTSVRRVLRAMQAGDLTGTVIGDNAAVKACGYIKLATCVAGTVIEVNGVPFTAKGSAATAGNNEFDISGADAADAAALAAAINASTSTGVSGVVTALANADKLTPSTAIAGNKFTVVLADGQRFTFVAKAGAATAGGLDFSIDTSNAATCASIVAQVNGHAVLGTKIRAIDNTTKVNFYSLTGEAFTLTGTASTLAEANDGQVQVNVVKAGATGNGITLKTLGVVGTVACTCASVVETDTLVINGVSLTAIVQRATGTLTADAAVAGNTCVVGGYTFTGVAGAVTLGSQQFSIDTGNTETATSLAAQINGFAQLSGIVTATSASDVVTVRAVNAGTAGNSIVLTGTALRLVASGSGTLAGGIAVANNQFDVSPGSTDTQVAADIARCVNASTTVLVRDHVRALSRAAVVHLFAKYPGTAGNAITSSSTGGTITVATARLAGGTELSSGGTQASGTLTLTSWLNGETVAVNGVTITAHTNTQANDQVDLSGADSADATNLALAINNSTTAGLQDVFARASSNVVTVTARKGGIAGNAITLSSGQASVVANVARLASGASPTTVSILKVGASDTVSSLRAKESDVLTSGAGTTVTLSF